MTARCRQAIGRKRVRCECGRSVRTPSISTRVVPREIPAICKDCPAGRLLNVFCESVFQKFASELMCAPHPWSSKHAALQKRARETLPTAVDRFKERIACHVTGTGHVTDRRRQRLHLSSKRRTDNVISRLRSFAQSCVFVLAVHATTSSHSSLAWVGPTTSSRSAPLCDDAARCSSSAAALSVAALVQPLLPHIEGPPQREPRHSRNDQDGRLSHDVALRWTQGTQPETRVERV